MDKLLYYTNHTSSQGSISYRHSPGHCLCPVSLITHWNDSSSHADELKRTLPAQSIHTHTETERISTTCPLLVATPPPAPPRTTIHSQSHKTCHRLIYNARSFIATYTYIMNYYASFFALSVSVRRDPPSVLFLLLLPCLCCACHDFHRPPVRGVPHGHWRLVLRLRTAPRSFAHVHTVWANRSTQSPLWSMPLASSTSTVTEARDRSCCLRRLSHLHSQHSCSTPTCGTREMCFLVLRENRGERLVRESWSWSGSER